MADKRRKSFLAFCLLLTVILSFGKINKVEAAGASLFFSPASGSFTPGKTFSVSVVLSSTEQSANALSGVVSFTKDNLEVVSLSKAGSVVNLWVQDPSFSNKSGTVNFEGLILNPGYKGSAGKVISIQFKVKSTGTAVVNFSSGSILANDGQGTNILGGLGSARFNIEVPVIGPTAPQATSPAEVSGILPAPAVNSPTHPNPDEWYALREAKLSWALPAGANATRLLIGELPQAVPTVIYSPAVDNKEIKDLEDGVWYFHVQLKNNRGWGGIAHYRLQVDTEKPEQFSIKPIPPKDQDASQLQFVFNASDKTSGIDHYQIWIDSQESEIWRDDGNHTYQTPNLNPGRHLLAVKAIDRAGNFLTDVVEFFVTAMDPPVWTSVPEEVHSGEVLVARGRTHENIQVVVYLEYENKTEESFVIESEENGDFIFVADKKLADGLYSLRAIAMDRNGSKSNFSDEARVVIRPPKFLKIGNVTVEYLSVIIPGVSMILLLIFLVWHGCSRLTTIKRKVRKEVGEAESALHYGFSFIMEDIQRHIKLLERTRKIRELTGEEEKTIEQFKKDLRAIEGSIGKEIKDIKDQVR